MEGFERFFLVLEFVFNGGEISLRRWKGLKLVKLQFGSKDKMAMKPSVVKPGEWH